MKRRKTKNFRTQFNDLYFKDMPKFNPMEKLSGDACRKVEDKWELPVESIVFEGVLGEGAFGLVKKGLLKKFDGQIIDVGIKMLKRKL